MHLNEFFLTVIKFKGNVLTVEFDCIRLKHYTACDLNDREKRGREFMKYIIRNVDRQMIILYKLASKLNHALAIKCLKVRSLKFLSPLTTMCIDRDDVSQKITNTNFLENTGIEQIEIQKNGDK